MTAPGYRSLVVFPAIHCSSRIDLIFEKVKDRCSVETESGSLVHGETPLFPDARFLASNESADPRFAEALEVGYDAGPKGFVLTIRLTENGFLQGLHAGKRLTGRNPSYLEWPGPGKPVYSPTGMRIAFFISSAYV